MAAVCVTASFPKRTCDLPKHALRSVRSRAAVFCTPEHSQKDIRTTCIRYIFSATEKHRCCVDRFGGGCVFSTHPASENVPNEYGRPKREKPPAVVRRRYQQKSLHETDGG